MAFHRLAWQVFYTDVAVIGITAIHRADAADPDEIKAEREQQFRDVLESMVDSTTSVEFHGSTAEVEVLQERAKTRAAHRRESDTPLARGALKV